MNRSYILTIGLLSLTIISGGALASNHALAEDVVDDVTITVPEACTMSGSGTTTHSASVPNGTYQANMGTTTITALCNDNAGFSIYATGYTGETIGQTNSNKLVGTNASGNATIDTGTATSAGNPDVSNWAMKLATDSQATYPLTLSTGYNAYHAVPNEYTKVATRTQGTDVGTGATGSTLTTTYAAYISKTQAADTYSGKVKYTLVHPNDGAAPIPPNPAPVPPTDCTTPVPNLTYMQDLTSANKASVLASMTEDVQYYLADKRDNKAYCVAKLKDGNIWMTQNLDHDIVTTENYYTNENTDIGWNSSTNSYNTATWTAERATYTTDNTTWHSNGYGYVDYPDGVNGVSRPESYDPGNIFWNGTAGQYNSESDCISAGGVWDSDIYYGCNLIASTGNSHYHLGNYYNWTAAVAMNDSSYHGYNDQTEEVEIEDANQSICPANWTLPKSGDENDMPSLSTSNGSFRYLVTQYGWNDSKMINPFIWNSPIKAALAGYWAGKLYYSGLNGDYWSSVNYYSSNAYQMILGDDGSVIPNYQEEYNDSGAGFSVRCLTR